MFITQKDKLTAYYAPQRVWQGIPGIEITRGGRLYATFYSGGITEYWGNYCVLIESRDGGKTWSEPVAACDAGKSYRCYDPCLWRDPQDRLWLFWAVAPEHAVWAVRCDDPDADEPVWTEPARVGDEVMMNKPTVLSTGEWLLPMAYWGCQNYGLSSHTDTHGHGPYAWLSADNGGHIEKLGGPLVEQRNFDEHMIVERRDGVLVMYIRVMYGIARSFSYDGGVTWTKAEDSGLGGPCSRFHIRRLKSGSLLLVNHWQFKGRNNLAAMISKDDGETWSTPLMLDERSDVSYPDMAEGADGTLYIIYDRGRGGYVASLEQACACPREILMAKVREEDILAGSLVCPDSSLKNIVNKLGAYEGVEDLYAENRACAVNDRIRELLAMDDRQAMIDTALDWYGCRCQSLAPEVQAETDDLVSRLLDADTRPDEAERLLRKMIVLLSEARESDGSLSDDALMKRVFALVNDNLAQEISAEDIAARLRMSRFYLSHLFRKKTGMTIAQYANGRRVYLAKQTLKNSETSVTDIGVGIGFYDASHFIRWFKRLVGMTPAEYRKLHAANR